MSGKITFMGNNRMAHIDDKQVIFVGDGNLYVWELDEHDNDPDSLDANRCYCCDFIESGEIPSTKHKKFRDAINYGDRAKVIPLFDMTPKGAA